MDIDKQCKTKYNVIDNTFRFAFRKECKMKAKKLPSGNYRVQVFCGTDCNGKNIMKSFTAKTEWEAMKMAQDFLDGKNLDYVKEKTGKAIYKETVEFVLLGNNFSGTDKFIVEHYDFENKLTKKDEALYSVAGVKISGTSEIK